MRRLVALSCLFGASAFAIIVDRIAVIVDKDLVKDSDIERTIRITSFLNREEPRFDAATRKATAQRLIDQALIRQQIRSGDYPVASEQEAANLLASTKHERYADTAQYQATLARYGITNPEVKEALLWQLTVLRFIDQRFRPAAVVTDQQIEDYYKAHLAELEAAHPQQHSLDDLRPAIEDTLAGEQVNKLFEDWLKDARNEVHVDYREAELR